MKMLLTRIAPSFEMLEARIAPAAVATINLGNLDGISGAQFYGASDSDHAGGAVSEAGDVNGDGIADFIITARDADPGGPSRGTAYVIFGNENGLPAETVLSSLNGTTGFALNGIANTNQAGFAVAGAGDVSGDGFDDVILSAPFAQGGGALRGNVYVVYGKADFSSTAGVIALSSLDGSNGFTINGAANSDLLGYSVGGAGDVNGDGTDDFVIGAQGADAGIQNGAAYVIFGKSGGFGATFSLSSLDGTNGFKLSGVVANDRVGRAVDAAGDVNGDGFGDVIVSGFDADEGGSNRGAVYVVFGKADFTATAGLISVSALDGSNGFKLSGVADEDEAGAWASGAGDLNGDHFADMLIGAWTADEGGTNRGAVYVVFGKSDFTSTAGAMALSSLDGSNGFKIAGEADNDQFGVCVSGAGDFNGDGLGDLLMGAWLADEGGNNRGAAYMVYGKADFTATGGAMSLADLDGANGFKLTGEDDGGRAGIALSAAGDVNGDGLDDILVGATLAAGGGNGRGAAYLLYGFENAEVTISANGRTATYTDWDGDVVTIKTSKGTLDSAQFQLFMKNPLTGGSHLINADFSGATTHGEFYSANLTFAAKRGTAGGDGLLNLGTLDASSTRLGKVSIDGDLQSVLADGITKLGVYSLGQFAEGNVVAGSVQSAITNKLGALAVKTDATGITLAAGSVGAITAGALDGVTLVANTFASIKARSLDDVHIYAKGVINPATPTQAVAMKSLTVSGSVWDSEILAGYDSAGAAVNADVQIGAVKVLGQWVASDLVAGAQAGDDGLFGTGDDNETLALADNAIVSRIASITIGGAVIGTQSNYQDGFGFVAEEIGSFRLGKAKLPLQTGARNDLSPLSVSLGADVRVLEVEEA